MLRMNAASCIKIQALIRGFIVRRRLANAKLHQTPEWRAAVSIQAAVRGHQQRLRYQTARRDVGAGAGMHSGTGTTGSLHHGFGDGTFVHARTVVRMIPGSWPLGAIVHVYVFVLLWYTNWLRNHHHTHKTYYLSPTDGSTHQPKQTPQPPPTPAIKCVHVHGGTRNVAFKKQKMVAKLE